MVRSVLAVAGFRSVVRVLQSASCHRAFCGLMHPDRREKGGQEPDAYSWAKVHGTNPHMSVQSSPLLHTNEFVPSSFPWCHRS